jgi:hypothetical protein
MSKGIITLLGAILCGAILVLGVVFGVVPLLTQALTVAGQSAQVAQTNALYEAQIAGLEAEQERLDEITASIDALRQGISAAPELDDVFELVARAAEISGVTVETIEAGESTAFAPRTAPTTVEEVVPETSAADAAVVPEPTPSASASTESEPTPAPAPQTATGRSQVDFTIRVDAFDMNQAVAFLDALRAGPRLFTNVETLVSSTGIVLDVDVTGLTYYLPEG